MGSRHFVRLLFFVHRFFILCSVPVQLSLSLQKVLYWHFVKRFFFLGDCLHCFSLSWLGILLSRTFYSRDSALLWWCLLFSCIALHRGLYYAYSTIISDKARFCIFLTRLHLSFFFIRRRLLCQTNQVFSKTFILSLESFFPWKCFLFWLSRSVYHPTEILWEKYVVNVFILNVGSNLKCLCLALKCHLPAASLTSVLYSRFLCHSYLDSRFLLRHTLILTLGFSFFICKHWWCLLCRKVKLYSFSPSLVAFYEVLIELLPKLSFLSAQFYVCLGHFELPCSYSVLKPGSLYPSLTSIYTIVYLQNNI